MIRRCIGALALLTVFATGTAWAQSTSSLQLKDASGAIQTESITPYNGVFYVNHMAWGWNVSLSKPLAWTMDLGGNGGVDANCLVVSADQSFSAGGYSPCTLATSGRLKVELSSAGVNGATGPTTSDELGGLDPGGLEQALELDALHNLKVYLAGGLGAAVATPLYTSDINDGVAGAGISPPTGASGALGWLSAIYKALTGTLSVAPAGAFAVQQSTGTALEYSNTPTTMMSGAGLVSSGTTLGSSTTPYTAYNVTVSSPTAGTLVEYYSLTGATYVPFHQISVTGGVPVTDSGLPIFGPTLLAIFSNTGANQTVGTYTYLATSVSLGK